MQYSLKKCNICPHNCGVDRTNNKRGFCGVGDKIKISLVTIHNYEEPCISGKNGSGTVFFSNCNLRCVYCQNYEISQQVNGEEITIERLADTFLELQQKKVNNINLVTPTMYALQIKEAIILAKNNGLKIPVIYNSSGYENVNTLKELNGYIDIYLPDFKYYSDELAFKYSGIKNYFSSATSAVLEMNRQVGSPKFNKDGIIQKGMIVRNLILPNNIKNTKNILTWIKENLGKETYVSIMAQYFPTNKSNMYEEINRKINPIELKMVKNHIYKLGLNNGYIQEIEKNEEKYVPNFNKQK